MTDPRTINEKIIDWLDTANDSSVSDEEYEARRAELEREHEAEQRKKDDDE